MTVLSVNCVLRACSLRKRHLGFFQHMSGDDVAFLSGWTVHYCKCEAVHVPLMCKTHEVPVCTHELLLVSKFTLTVLSRSFCFFLCHLQVFFTLFTQYYINDLPCFRIELEVRKILTVCYT